VTITESLLSLLKDAADDCCRYWKRRRVACRKSSGRRSIIASEQSSKFRLTFPHVTKNCACRSDHQAIKAHW